MKLKDKVAIVTGAAGGIGRAHALRLARLGADVVINDIDLKAYKKYGEKITEDSVVRKYQRSACAASVLKRMYPIKPRSNRWLRRSSVNGDISIFW